MMLRKRSILSFTVLLASAASMAVAAEAGEEPPSATKIWNGIYTPSQADRGKAGYLKFCASCHAPDLGGGAGRGPALLGESFMQDWRNSSVNALFVKMRDGMPANYPQSVTSEVKIDVLSFLLQVNGFPSGVGELKIVEKDLSDILIVQKGEQKVPNFALVRMVGCLAQDQHKSWVLLKSTEPIVTKEEVATPALLKGAVDGPLGTLSFELISVSGFKPESSIGQRVEARGLLYREGNRNLLNLTSLNSVGSSCN